MPDKALKILGVRVDNMPGDEIESEIRTALQKKSGRKFVVTLNPEISLKAYRDENYRNILNSADLNLIDGFGMKFISFLKGKKIKDRFTGVELTDFLMKKAKNTNLKVLVVVSKNSLSAPLEIERGIMEKFDLASKAKYFPDPNFFDCEEAKEAQIILVNFGAPEQEKFINEYKHKFPEARILAGVGGAFDFLTGKFKRAPKIFRNMGLEWLWRLLQEPKRIKRIYNAVIAFPFLSLTRK